MGHQTNILLDFKKNIVIDAKKLKIWKPYIREHSENYKSDEFERNGKKLATVPESTF